MVLIGQNKKGFFLIWVAVGAVQAVSRACCRSVQEAREGCRELGGGATGELSLTGAGS